MANPRVVTPADYERIDAAVKPTGDEVYAVLVHRHRGQFRKSVHVFKRTPNEHELQKYETTASSVEFRNKKAKVKGSGVLAANVLYDLIIARVYDIPVGTKVHEQLDAAQAAKVIDPMTKRSAIVELVGQVWSASSADDDEEDDDAEDTGTVTRGSSGETS